jgi:hypothetical protein
MASVIKFTPRSAVSEDDLREHVESLLSASRVVEDCAYAMAGDFEPGIVAEMMLLSARLEGISRRIAKPHET